MSTPDVKISGEIDKPSPVPNEKAETATSIASQQGSQNLPEEKNEDLGDHPYRGVIIRLLSTVALVLALLGLLKGYESKEALTQNEKYTFNTLNVFISTLLALNMTVTYTTFIKLIRAGIRTKHKDDITHWSQKELGERFKELGGFRGTCSFVWNLFRSKPEPGTRAILSASSFILLWLLFNLGVTIAVALLGLTYSPEDGAIGKKSGTVRVADLTHCYGNSTAEEKLEPELERFYCNAFAGTSVLDASPPFYEKSSIKTGYKFRELKDGWEYNFREESAHDKSIRVLSKHSVKTGANCTDYKVRSINFDNRAVEFYTGNEQWTSMTFNVLAEKAMNYYNFMTGGQPTSPCEAGLGCDSLMVIETGERTDVSSAHVYECTSWVEQISPSTELEYYHIRKETAIYAATSLAHSGISGKNEGNGDITMFMSYYGQGFGWGVHANGNATAMAKIISKASAGVFAVMDQVNPRKLALGSEPWSGVSLKVKWDRVIPLLVIVGVLQMLAVLPAIFWHKKHRPLEASA